MVMSRDAREVLFRLTLGLTLVSAIGSVAGLFFEREWYWRDLPYWTTQVAAQDAANLAIVLPLLLLSAWRMRQGSVAGTTAWLGLLLFLTYVYACFGFSLRFNRGFLLDLTALALCIYQLAIASASLRNDPSAPPPAHGSAWAAWFLIAVGLAMSTVWLVDAIPSIAGDTLPEYAVTNGYVTSPIHLLDLGLFFPGMVVAGVLMRRRRPAGSVLGPAFLVFSAVMTSCLVEQALALHLRGRDDGLALTPIFALVFLGSIGCLRAWFGEAPVPASGPVVGNAVVRAVD